MPLLSSPMREIERYGVKIDICTSSGGIWLDRGELERIIMAIREEALMDGGVSAEEAHGDVHYHEEPRRAERPRPNRRKRESMFESIMDIFD